ncbi:MAG: hypothetical protein D6776_11345 [Planctomycetota bacterium]|nr:MAG: hypothetical protein D6776_11345 [Planctomycetota bacterium]
MKDPERSDALERLRTEQLPRLLRAVRAIIWFLMALDVGALWLLLWRAGLDPLLAVPLAFFVAWLTSYRAQFKHLLSPRELQHHGSPLRMLLTALLLLAINTLSVWLIAIRMYFTYLALRVTTAAIVLWAWGRREAPRWLETRLGAIRRGALPDLGAGRDQIGKVK